jgi:hypothetical protein
MSGKGEKKKEPKKEPKCDAKTLPYAKPGVTRRVQQPFYMCKYCLKPFADPDNNNQKAWIEHQSAVGKCNKCGVISCFTHQRYCNKTMDMDICDSSSSSTC